MKKYLIYSNHVEPSAKPHGEGWYFIKGEAIIREKMYPYKHWERVSFEFGITEAHEAHPFYICHGLIDMGNDIQIPVEWVTAKSEFYGPIVFIEPWRGGPKE